MGTNQARFSWAAAVRLTIALMLQVATCVALAHGGVAVEDDTCIMTIGPYKAHFTGYQPMARASQEFCEDIPTVTESIIVVDFISRPLREMAVDFRIVRDVNEVGVGATYADLGSSADITKATVFYRPAERFPRGSLDVTIPFDQPGTYIGVLTAIDDKTDTVREYISVFPFSVGVINWWARLKWVILSLIIGVGLFFWSSRSKKSTHVSG